jgi:hypothetical protein
VTTGSSVRALEVLVELVEPFPQIAQCGFLRLQLLLSLRFPCLLPLLLLLERLEPRPVPGKAIFERLPRRRGSALVADEPFVPLDLGPRSGAAGPDPLHDRRR